MTLPDHDRSRPTRRSVDAAASVLRDGSEERVELISLLDEELAVLLRETGVDAAPVWMPWAAENTDGLDAAVPTVRRILMRRRQLVPELLAAELEERDLELADDQLVADPTTAGVLVLRRSAVAVTTAIRTVALAEGPRELRCWFYHQSNGVTLEERVTAEGLHDFAVQPTAAMAERLAQLVDPDGVASEDSEAREVTAGTPPEEWGPGIADRPRHLTQAVMTTPQAAMARSASFHATDDAVHVAAPDLSVEGPLESVPLQVAQVSPDSLRDVLAALIEFDEPSRPGAL